MTGTTKPSAIGFNHIALEVGDIDEALTFYGRIFDFQLRAKSKAMAFIDLGDQFIALQAGRTQPADDGRQNQCADEHPETHDALRHDVLRRDQEQQEGADLRHEDTRDEHHPDDRAERHAEEQDLARRRHPAEQQSAGPAERGRQDLGREAGAQGDEGGEDGHGRRVGPRA